MNVRSRFDITIESTFRKVLPIVEKKSLTSVKNPPKFGYTLCTVVR